MKKWLFLLLLCTLRLSAQSYNVNVGGISYSSGPSVPGSCSPEGSWFFKNVATTGWYQCSGGTYSAVSGGGGGAVSSVFGRTGAVVSAAGDYDVSQLTSASAHSLAIFQGGSPPTLLISPTTNGPCQVYFNVTGSAAVDPTCALPGIAVNAQSGNYSLLYSDRGAYIKYSGGTTATLTLPQVTGSTASNFPFVTQNLNSGNQTLTANAADKIDNSATGGSATLLPNFAAFVYQDASSAPGNWWTLKLPTYAAFGATGALCSWSTTTGWSCGNATGDVTTSGSLAFTLAASGVSGTTCGDTTHSCGLTYNSKGLITAVTNNVISGGGGGTGALAAVTNTTAVTVSNPTAATDTQLMEVSLAAAYLNTAGQPYRIYGSGVLTTTTASTPQVTITAKLCSVSGCGSGTVTPLAAIQSTALNTVAISNATWAYDLTATTVGTGASCTLIVKGSPGLVIENAASVATADSVYADSNTVVSSPTQNCANALFVDFFVQQSATGASNSYKQLLGAVMPQGGGPVLSVGLKTGVVSLADASATQYVAGGGSAQAQTATLSPALAANTAGSVVWWLPTAANTAAAPTLAVNGLTAKTITKCGTVALVASDLLTTAPAEAIYDGTEWVLLNPQGIGCATTSGGYIFNGVTSATAVVMPAANSTKLWAFIANASLVTSAHFSVNVTTVDNSANLYNFAVFCAAGDPRCTSGNPICQTGAIAGSSIPTPGSTGLKIIAWSGACGPFVMGQRYYLAETAVTSTLVIGGVANLPSPVCGQAPATNNTTASAVWTTPITYSGDTNIVGCNGPALAIYPN